VQQQAAANNFKQPMRTAVAGSVAPAQPANPYSPQKLA
jgi:hypothetical protein